MLGTLTPKKLLLHLVLLTILTCATYLRANAEPSGIQLTCKFTSLEISAQGSTDKWPFDGKVIAELALDAKTACIDSSFKNALGANIENPKKCFELEVHDEKFVVRKEESKNLGGGQAEQKGPLVIFRHSGKAHIQNIESHFNGDFVKKYDFFGDCEKTGEFVTRKKF